MSIRKTSFVIGAAVLLASSSLALAQSTLNGPNGTTSTSGYDASNSATGKMATKPMPSGSNSMKQGRSNSIEREGKTGTSTMKSGTVK